MFDVLERLRPRLAELHVDWSAHFAGKLTSPLLAMPSEKAGVIRALLASLIAVDRFGPRPNLDELYQAFVSYNQRRRLHVPDSERRMMEWAVVDVFVRTLESALWNSWADEHFDAVDTAAQEFDAQNARAQTEPIGFTEGDMEALDEVTIAQITIEIFLEAWLYQI